MLNTACVREARARGKTEGTSSIGFERHDHPFTASGARYETSRCLANISCEACDACRFLCPDLAITRDRVTGEIVVDLDYCKGCGICAFVCPKGAITMVLEQSI
jgi:2-oxoacid:acceptor oxidoreductase delta subunit (pyruvate/2-ketoisovalerate family)